MLALVEDSHMKMCPDVPLAGWDVVFSADPKVPICLLEVNLSCNFFRGSFDKKVSFCDSSKFLCVSYLCFKTIYSSSLFSTYFRFFFDLCYNQVYLDFVDESFAKVQALRLTADAENKNFVRK